MATYLQWARTCAVKPLAWVCGPEPALVRLVLDAYRDGAENRVVLFGTDPDRDVWDRLASVGQAGPEAAVVHAAEKLKNLAPLAGLAAGIPEGSRVVFVSAADDFDRAGDGKKALVPHLAAVQAAKDGQLIRCCAPAKAEDQAQLAASWWPGAGRNLGWDILKRCGSLTAAAQACEKAVRAGLEPTKASLEAVCEPEPGASFADPLVAGNKTAAMAAAQLAGRAETGLGLAILASRLTALAAISEAQRAGAGPRELHGRVQVDRWLISRLAPYARPYDGSRVARCRELLAGAESWHRSGASAGVAQAVVAGW